MPITYHAEEGQFHLFNQSISYIFHLLPNQQLGHIYFGRRLRKVGSVKKFRDFSYHDMSPVVDDDDISFSLDNVQQEISIFGNGDLRTTSCKFNFKDGSHQTVFKYTHHEIFQGKPELAGLPSTYVNSEDEGTSLWVYLFDDYHKIELVMKYFIFEEYGGLTRSIEVINRGEQAIELSQISSCNIDFSDYHYDLYSLTGAWGRERHVEKQSLHRGVQQIYSLRGHSSHQYNPFFALGKKDCTEFSGEAYGISLVYSGNFLGQIDVDNYHHSRVFMGIHPTGFLWELKTGESFQTPEVLLVHAQNGLNDMSQTFHQIYNKHLIRGPWKQQQRPILINNWEGTYMDFNEKKILAMAKEASTLGIELFVLDDGWFGKRDTDRTSLGDWFPNDIKLPNGIAVLSRKINALGMKFGLWFEPEMISRDSELFAKHPEWLLGNPQQHLSVGRHQYYLDFSKQEVVDYLFMVMSKVIAEGELDYIKWDLNRSMSEVFSQGGNAEKQGKVYHQAVLGMYQLHERLLQKFPNLLIESCASGGARFDPGMLYYAPQGWISDDTDAFERIKIQYGTSFVYPISSMGAHVSVVPNHQTQRMSSMQFRGDVASFGTFGYELDSTNLSDEEKREIVEQVQFVKEFHPIIQYGTFYRLIQPYDNKFAAWMSIDKEKQKGVIGIYKLLQEVNGRMPFLKLQGLEEEFLYRLSFKEKEFFFYGGELLHIGIPLSSIFSKAGDFLSELIIIEKSVL